MTRRTYILLGILSLVVGGVCLALLTLLKWELPNALTLFAGLLASLSFAVAALFRPDRLNEALISFSKTSAVGDVAAARTRNNRNLEWGIKLSILSGVLFALMITLLGTENDIVALVISAPVLLIGLILLIVWLVGVLRPRSR